MGKIKSAIITSIMTLAVVVLLLFSVISCDVVGTVSRYNGILANIHLDSTLTGEIVTTVLPDGIITAEQYKLSMPETDRLSDDYDADALSEYKETYTKLNDNYYAEVDLIDEYGTKTALREAIKADADILSSRFNSMSYTSYSVAVVDDYAIRVALPSNFTYATYKGNDYDSYTDRLSEAASTITYLICGGELTLRNTTSSITSRLDEDYGSTGSLLQVRANIADYFKSITAYSKGGSYAVKITLTSTGLEKLETISKKVKDSDDTYIRFYVGTNNILNLTCEDTIEDKTFYISVSDLATAKNYAALLGSVANGDALSLDYSYDEVTAVSSASGQYTAVITFVAILVIMAAIAVALFLYYKMLGLVISLMMVAMALSLEVTLFFIATPITVLGIIIAILMLMLFVGSNYWSVEAIKRELSVGRTVNTAIKTGYKKTVGGILDLHLTTFIVGCLLSFIAVGEACSIGIVLAVCSIASYVCHWVTRYMWHVTMSQCKSESDKRAFFGVKALSFEEMEEEIERSLNSAKVEE